VTATLHVLHAGDGYAYLTNSVASGDVTRGSGDPLVGYYTAKGNPPGQWVGSGLADLGMAGVVTEEHMLALFGEGLRPDANEFIAAAMRTGRTFQQAQADARLGRRFYQFDNQVPLVEALKAAYRQFETDHNRRATVVERREIKTTLGRTLLRQELGGREPTRDEVRAYLTDQLGKARQPVAGFDTVFTPGGKSVQALMLDDETRPVLLAVHDQAWRAAIAYGEAEAAFTRVGKDGIAQVRVHGFVATAFTHWDSRAGDPNLHTHVAISNRVLADDGIWRTLDSKQLHAIAVSMSEMYNALIEQGLTDRLGVRWVEVSKGPNKRPVREIDGIPEEWNKGFSRRRSDIETRYDELIADYVRQYGHTPTRTMQIRLAQQATLETRPDKEALRSLAELVQQWRATAHQLLPGASIRAVIRGCLGRADGPAAESVDLAALAAAVIDVVSTERSTWNVYHVRAEATRALKPVRYPSAQARQQAIEIVVGHALGRESFLLAVEMDTVPRLLQRPEGESVFHRHGSELFTSQVILDAETRLVQAAHTRRGPVVDRHTWQAAVRRFERASGKELNPGQRALVEHIVSCGMALARAVGPPGTGKSTAMRAVREAWETTGGRVIGLAPSAAAASVLGDELGVHADTLHSLVLKYQNDELDVEAGDMLLIDESGMAGTRMVDQVRRIAEERGAVLRVVGDHRQLPAVEAGGWFRLLDVLDLPGVELTEVHRFVREDEAAAVLAFRVGDDAAIPFYANNNRLVGGARAAVLDRLYADWQADLDNGRTAIMISDSTEVARDLSARAQTDRRAAGLVEDTGVELHDHAVAGVGDRVVTRLNRRRLAVNGGRDYVKNGDLWQVLKRYRDGRLKVRHVRHGGQITLPAWYVAEYTELGYAATIHRSQGLTVDVARSFLTPAAYREAALVALSRGIEGNYAYLDTEQMLDPDEPQVLPGDLFYRNRETSEAAAALTQIMRREGAERSATEELRDALDAPYRLDTVVPQFDYGLHVYRGPDALRVAEDWVRQAVPTYADAVVADEAWPALAAVLHEVRDAGVDPAVLLAHRAAQRALVDDPHDPARSVAQVLHYRVVEDMPTSRPGPHRPNLLPGWVATPPTDADDANTVTRVPAEFAGPVIEVGQWLRQRADQIAARVQVLGERAADNQPVWSGHLGAVPDDPAARQVWIVRAGQVAAYRERYRYADTIQALLPGGQRGEQMRARAWVQQYLATNPLPVPPEDVAVGERLAARTAGLRHRLANLADQLAQPLRDPSSSTTPRSPSEADPGPDSTDRGVHDEEAGPQ
jgi:conjugative relaxase-like TrwC/TraI family protein